MRARLDPFPALAAIYAAGLDAEHWQHALGSLVENSGASGGQLLVSNLGTRSLFSVGIDPEENERYNQHYSKLDPIPAKLNFLRAGSIVSCRELVSRNEARRNEFFVEWADPNCISDAVFLKLSDESCPVCALALGHPGTSEPFLQPELKAYLEHLAPHLVNAFNIARSMERITAEARACRDAFDALGCGWLLVSEGCRVNRLNDVARAMLDEGDGLRLRNGMVELMDRHIHDKFSKAVRAAAGAKGSAPDFGKPLEVPRLSGAAPYIISLMPHQTADARFGNGCDQVTVIVTDPARDDEAVLHALRTEFGLTAAEAQVAITLRRGGGLGRVALDRGISLSTARIHLQRAFEKTDTHRQSELIMLMQRLHVRPWPQDLSRLRTY